MNRVLLVVAGLSLLVTSGCQPNKVDEEQCVVADPNAPAEAGFVNAACPVMPGDDARGSGVSVAYTGTNPQWQGKKVALCCKGCIPKWEKMTPAQRDEKLAQVASK